MLLMAILFLCKILLIIVSAIEFLLVINIQAMMKEALRNQEGTRNSYNTSQTNERGRTQDELHADLLSEQIYTNIALRCAHPDEAGEPDMDLVDRELSSMMNITPGQK
ncbi:uncharacterized protein LOC131053091 [Cryptomeria japonica]|uniref:uncharacterized protein LOC131053091 n=1 Tax=Cryptomeria japonica TaxID=3369 RepID=UPI0025AB8015|nr:uncharacterized protein LOC131053091 [Cryptomeria japonica]